MKVAVIGSGAAAAGILAGLERFASGRVEISMFDVSAPLIAAPPGAGDGRLPRSEMSRIYRRVRAEQGTSFPPPKTHFGQSLSKIAVGGRPLLWKSEHRGGLTNFWGGGMFPFTDREFAGWPVTAAQMDRYYRIIAEKVGVCGEADPLNSYFSEDYVNRPPLRTSPVIRALRDTINRNGGNGSQGVMGQYRLIAGASRLALETREAHPRACVYCGECMLGCPREAIWSAGRDVDRYQAEAIVRTYIVGSVRYVRNRHVHFEVGGPQHRSPESAGPFDRIYIAAGCIGSTEIVMRTFGLTQGPQMLDSAILSFPILYLGGAGGVFGGDDGYFSLCNLSIMGVPQEQSLGAAQVSIYPAFDHLWRYYTAEPLWGLMQKMWRLARWRLMLGRVYLNGAADRKLQFELSEDQLHIRPGPRAEISAVSKGFMASLRQATNHAGFHIPAISPLGHGTSSHYGGTLPYGGPLVDVQSSGRIAPGVYLADASTFPSLPAISPTFTIMANACRTAYEGLQD